MMNRFFSLYTLTPWETHTKDKLSEVKLLSIKRVFKTYPVIEASFFDDIVSKIYNNKEYSWYRTIRRIVGPQGEDYDITMWNFIWGVDKNGRLYQLLFQNKKKQGISQGILVALAPPELAKLFQQHKRGAIQRILNLLQTPSKMRFVTVLAPKGKSIMEEHEHDLFKLDRDTLQKMKMSQRLKAMPNVKGEWFPTFKPRCPICNEVMTGLNNYKIGFGKLVCPRCGYQMDKK
ncbi:MAG: hypothetical protein R6U96_05660 [Promethearchaeia archaeon]